jgi:hypothetical protein
LKTLECKYKDLVLTRPKLPSSMEALLDEYSGKLELSPL